MSRLSVFTNWLTAAVRRLDGPVTGARAGLREENPNSMNLFLTMLPLAADPSTGDLGTGLSFMVLWLAHIGIYLGSIGLVIGVCLLIFHRNRARKVIEGSIVALLVSALLPTAAAWLTNRGFAHIVASIRVGP